MEGDVVRVTSRGEREAVEEEKGEDDHDGQQDAPPKLLVHGLLGMLLALT